MPVLQERVFDGRWAGSQCREERPRESLQSTTLVCTPSPHLAEHWRWRNIIKILRHMKVHFLMNILNTSNFFIAFHLNVLAINHVRLLNSHCVA